MTSSKTGYTLITRPEPEASALAALLAKYGFSPLCQPLLDVKKIPAGPVDITDYDALIFTSANGVRFFQNGGEFGGTVLTIGKKTELIAHTHGYMKTKSFAGEFDDLQTFINRHKDQYRKILYPCGQHRARAFSDENDITLLPVYKAAKVRELKPETRQAFEEKKISHALFFSARTAENFVRLVYAHGYNEACSGITALCLSEKISGKLKPLDFAAIEVSNGKTSDAIVTLLKQKE